MKRNLFIIIALCACMSTFAQGGEIDALRFSRNDLTGTARGQAMGGAFGALGGDVTGVAINPAGIGVYRSSEIVASMDFTSTNIETNWKGLTDQQSKFKFNFDNISYMGYFPTGRDGVQSVNFGFSYNRLKNFDRRYNASGRNMGSSLTDFIANATDGTDYRDLLTTPDYDPYLSGIPWLSILGFQGDLISVQRGKTDQYNAARGPEETVNPMLSLSERGYVESYDFTVGTNVADKLYFGLSFSLTDAFYSMSSKYTENINSGANEGYDLYNDLETDGSGYQVSLGAIYRPVDALRIGVAYHSPTWYTMTDYYTANTIFEYKDEAGEWVTTEAWTPDEPYAHTDYKFQTPYSWVFSVASIIGTHAIVSLDYEIKDYTTMNFKDVNGYNDWMNDYIDQDFKLASTIRAGIEYRVTPQFSARLGYAWMQNPYETTFKEGGKEVTPRGTIPHYTIEGDINHLTCGLGYKITHNFYADLAFVWRSQTDDLYYFSKFFDSNNHLVVDSTPAKLKNNTYKGMLTLGYKF